MRRREGRGGRGSADVTLRGVWPIWAGHCGSCMCVCEYVFVFVCVCMCVCMWRACMFRSHVSCKMAQCGTEEGEADLGWALWQLHVCI